MKSDQRHIALLLFSLRLLLCAKIIRLLFHKLYKTTSLNKGCCLYEEKEVHLYICPYVFNSKYIWEVMTPIEGGNPQTKHLYNIQKTNQKDK